MSGKYGSGEDGSNIEVQKFLGRCHLCGEMIYEGYKCGYMFLFGCLVRLRAIKEIEEEVKKSFRDQD